MKKEQKGWILNLNSLDDDFKLKKIAFVSQMMVVNFVLYFFLSQQFFKLSIILFVRWNLNFIVITIWWFYMISIYEMG